MANQAGKAIFIGNIKGGVGKSTLAVYLTDYLRNRFRRRSIMLLDTDPQGSSFEMMSPLSKSNDIKHMPVGDRYDGVNMTTLDGVLRRMLAQDQAITIIDTGAGKLGTSGRWPCCATHCWFQHQCPGRICVQPLISSRKLMSAKRISTPSSRM